MLIERVIPRRVVVLCIAVTVLSACRDAVAPAEAAVRGTYALVSVNGKALPADMTSDGSGRILLLSETMAFDGHGNATDELTERDSLSSAPAQVFLARRLLAYSVDGSTIHFTVECGPGVSCINGFPNITILGADEIGTQVPGTGGMQGLVYRRMF